MSQPTAVIILGNPRYFNNSYAEPFYAKLFSFLESLGYVTSLSSSSPSTTIPPADLWVCHSRGAGRLGDAPEGTRTVALGVPEGIYHPKDNAATLTEFPPPKDFYPNKYHYTFTEEMKNAIRKVTPKTAGVRDKVIWSGVMLDNPGDLTQWWENEVGPLLPKVFSHHMTITFKPSPEQVESLPLGREVQLKVDGYVEDEKGQAVRVRGYTSSNPVAHITVATDGTSPVYSNTLFREGPVRPIDGPVLSGKVGVSVAGGAIRYAFTVTGKHDPSRNAYQNEYQKNRYHERKDQAVKMLGGKCAVCGTTRNLELDHKNPASKKFTITKLWSVPEAEFKAEVKKCRLLCHKHHLENSAKQREKGTVKSVPGKSEYDSKNRKKADASPAAAAHRLANTIGEKYSCKVVKDTDFDKASGIDMPVITWNTFDPDEKGSHQLLFVIYGREKDAPLVRTLVKSAKQGIDSLGAKLEYVDDRKEPGLLCFAVSARH